MNPSVDAVLPGLLVGAALGAAVTMSRFFASLVLTLVGLLIVYYLLFEGMAELEGSTRNLIDQAMSQWPFVGGGILGTGAALALMKRRG